MTEERKRMTEEEALKLFGALEEFRKPGKFDTKDKRKDLKKVQDGPFSSLFMKHGVAGIFQFYGPFPPSSESVLAITSEGSNVQYFLDFTPEAGSWFLAWNLTPRPLATMDTLEAAARRVCEALRRELQKHMLVRRNHGHERRAVADHEDR